ncbi:MAG: methyltransferase domain-containing protein [Bacteroidetes bacterium]|nr:MAG: methyltransferase domain-containing protein [Bacteroidota bacterium]
MLLPSFPAPIPSSRFSRPINASPGSNLWSKLTEEKAARKALEVANVQNGEQVLEVAVGTGLLFREMVKRNPDGLNEGIDLSPAMLAKCEKLLASQPAQAWHLQQASAFELPFPANHFDLLINNYMIDLLPEADFERVLGEFHRVLKPGGRAVITYFATGTRWYHFFWQKLAQYVPALLTNCRPIDLKPYVALVGFEQIQTWEISQNSFPSVVLKCVKG